MAQEGTASPTRTLARLFAKWQAHVERHVALTVIAVLAFVTGILYQPALTAYFISDDFSQVNFLVKNAGSLLNGLMWKEWFVGVLDGYAYFRPAAYLITFVDFLTWNQFAPGYHLTRILLHILSSFLVFLIAWQLTHRRTTAAMAAFLFAILPVHAGAVSWMAATTDVVCGLAFLTGFLFFVLYRRQGKRWIYAVAFGAYIIALAAKEVGIAFPLAILAYDVIFNLTWRPRLVDWVSRHAPFWAVLVLYLLMRVFYLGSFGYRGTQFGPEDVWNWLNGTIGLATAPFLTEAGLERWLVLVIIPPIIWLARRERRIIAFGLVWIPLTFIATINSLTGASDRSFYVPSLGLVLVLASVATYLLSTRQAVVRAAATAGLVALVYVYGQTLLDRNNVYHRAGEIAESIPAQVKALHPSLPENARLVFVGVPDRMPDGTLVYLTGFYPAMALAYPSSKFETSKFDQFPIWFDALDRTYFFQVDHRKVVERTDLVNTLQERRECASPAVPILTWDFRNDKQGWEPWNDITEFDVRDGALRLVAEGKDPNIAAPAFSIPSVAISNVEIEMSVVADQPRLTGQLYWLTSEQPDFTPGMEQSFPVQADGAFHTYSVDLINSSKLVMESRITQFRFDPVDAPGQIAIRSVRVLSPCSTSRAEICNCR